MKKLLFLIVVGMLVLPIVAEAGFLGLKKVDEFISMPLITLDSNGIRRKPDSVHIFVYRSDSTALVYENRSTTYPFAIGVDTSKIYGDTTYYFVDQIQDIDGAPPNAQYDLTVHVVMWAATGLATDNWGTVQVINDSLQNYLDSLLDIRTETAGLNGLTPLQAADNIGINWADISNPTTGVGLTNTTILSVGTATNVTNLEATAVDDIWDADTSTADAAAGFGLALARGWDTTIAIIDTLQRFTKPATDTLQGIIDTLQLQDGWVAREASLYDPATDSVIVDASSAQVTGGLIPLIADTTWLSLLEARDGVAGSFGDSAQGWGATSAGGTDTLNIKTMMERNFTSASGGDGWANMLADTTWLLDTTGNRIATGFGRVLAAINDTIETLATITDIQTTGSRTVVKRGIVKTLPDVSGFSSTVFTEGDDYWIDNLIEMRDGTAVGQITRISDFTAATDSATFSPSFSVEPAIGDSFYVLAAFSEPPSSGGFDTLSTVFVDRLAGRVADTTWLSLLEARDGTAGSFGDSAQGWGATSAGSTDTLNIKTMMERNFTSASGGDGWANMLADTTWLLDTTGNKIATGFGNILGKINDTAEAQDGWVAKEATVQAHFDTLIYIGEHGLGIFVDSTAGNTNTVIGTDGTEKNPVSTLAAARTLALALGAHRFYIHGGSTFNGAGTDLGADYSEWEFYGEGFGIEIAFGGQLVTNSYFQNVTLSGVMHASGGDVHYVDCRFGFISSDFQGHAEGCELTDTIVTRPASDVSFHACFSGLAPEETPTIDFGVGANTVVFTSYSGGLRLMNGSSNDMATVSSDGHLIISANNTSLRIMAHGMINLTDSGTTTNLTQDAVWNRGSVDTVFIPATVDSNWNELVADHAVALTYGDTLPKVIEDILDSLEVAAMDNLKEAFDDDGVGSDMDLNGLHIVATGTNDTGVVIRGDGSGSGSFVAGGATGLGLAIEGGATSGGGIDVSTTNGHGMQLTGTGTNNGIIVTGGVTAVRLIGTGTGNGLQASGGATGSGFRIDGGATSGDALRILTSGSGDFISSGARDELATTISDSVWLSLLEARDGVAGSFGDSSQGWGAAGGGGGLDTLQTVFVDRLTTRIADSIWLALLEARDGVAGSFGDSAQGWGASGGGGGNDTLLTAFVDRLLTRISDSIWLSLLEARDGTAGSFGDSSQGWGRGLPISGPNVTGFHPIDTTGVGAGGDPDTVSGVIMGLQDANGTNITNLLSNSAGFSTINLVDGNHTVAAQKTGYAFIDTTFDPTGGDTIPIHGYRVTTGAPGGGNEVTIFGYVYDILDTADAMANVWVFIEPVNQANNTCDSTITPRFMKRKLTGADGKFEFDVVRSSCLSDTDYRIWMRWEGGETTKHIFTAPDAATFRILW